MSNERAPLPVGTRIVYADMVATVVEDFGGGSLVVEHEGVVVKWRWTCDGETCRVLDAGAQA